MEPALDVIHRALQGDPGARSFLERTTSIYVLDVTNSSKPKTYGCWNFIHQAMNEVERHEAKYDKQQGFGDLVGHARLLASLALRVARRSPAADQALVATCVENASHYSGSQSQAQWLINLNLELREIVMGRIAAMAFDFSFHRRTGTHGQSAFADSVVMDTFCAILSANAVSTGPSAIEHFAAEWIFPSSTSLPSFAVASVVLHLGMEAVRKSAPAGTKDILQQMSVPAMTVVLVPILINVMSEDESNGSASSTRLDRSKIAALCVRAMKTWCDATDLSLPQIKHVCSKAGANIVNILSDAMYNDSHEVIDALAEFVDAAVVVSDDKVMSRGRMDQVRHILQVDEKSFRSQFNSQQLKTIESHEMSAIVDELISAISLQRLRFSDRHSKGDYDVCRNLTRIASSVCSTWLDTISLAERSRPEPGVIDLLTKSASHPSVNLCAIVLPVLTKLMHHFPYLTNDLLPLLQRRAIIPHHIRNGTIYLEASDSCGVTYHEYNVFRSTLLADALVTCWRGCSEHYMDSCTTAVEEFCNPSSGAHVSLQLEAALYCIEKTADEVAGPQKTFPLQHGAQLTRLFECLPNKPSGLMGNPLTRERLCCFLRQYCRWSVENSKLHVAADLAIACLSTAISLESLACVATVHDIPRWVMHEACMALKVILCSNPESFGTDQFLTSLTALWEASYTAMDNVNAIKINERAEMATGICYVLATRSSVLSKGSDSITKELETLVVFTLGRLERLTKMAQDDQTLSLSAQILSLIAEEIELLATMCRSFTDAFYLPKTSHIIDLPADQRTPMSESILRIIHRAWPCIAFAAAHWVNNKRIAQSLSVLLDEMLPSTTVGDAGVKLLRELTTISFSFLRLTGESRAHPEIVFGFLNSILNVHGVTAEKTSLCGMNGLAMKDHDREINQLCETIILTTVSSLEDYIGENWSSQSEQRNAGQVAFESKSCVPRKTADKSSEALAAVLTFLAKALDVCPVFLLQLRLKPYAEHEESLIRRAVDVSMTSLTDSDPEIAKSAILLLKAMAKQRLSRTGVLNAFAAESLSGIRGRAIEQLIRGSCGKYDYEVLRDVGELLLHVLSATPTFENEPHIVAALRSEHFLLGDTARSVALRFLTKWSSPHAAPSKQPSELVSFLQDVWHLHQIDDTVALPASDVVLRFVQNYS